MRTETVYRNGQRCTVRESRIDAPLPAIGEREAWHILRVEARYEVRAARSLGDIGLTTYCPLLERLTLQGRKTVFRTEHALIPGYVFAAFNPAIPQIGVLQTTGVIDFLRAPDSRNRIVVPDSVMQALARPVVAIDNVLATGQRVRILSGPMAGFFATLQRSGPGLLRVVVDTLGWKVTTSLDEVEILIP